MDEEYLEWGEVRVEISTAPLAFASLVDLAMWSWRHVVGNDTLLGDSWSLCAWTIRHVIRHHIL